MQIRLKHSGLVMVLIMMLGTACATKNCDLEQIYQSDRVCTEALCPPAMPQDGPGSPLVPHADVKVTVLSDGMFDATRSVIFEPSSPQPERAPVLFFLHGFFDADPRPYETMLRHFARKGYIVIYPSYGFAWNPKSWADNAEDALRRALDELKKPGHIRPEEQRLAFVGHSMGGILALHLAERAAKDTSKRIPQPKVLVTLDGAGISTIAYPYVSVDELSHIPASTWLLMIMAQESYQGRFQDAHHCEGDDKNPAMACNAFSFTRRAWQNTPQIPLDRKTALMIQSDSRQGITLRSAHNAVQGYCGVFSQPIDAIDTWGYWKLTVGALDEALRDEPGPYAFTQTQERDSVGLWSDGQPVKPILSLESCLQKGLCPDQLR